MKTVIFVAGDEKFADRRRLAGLAEHAHSHDWNLQSVESLRSVGQLKELMRIWRPDGFVVSCGAGFNRIPTKCFGGLPVVFSKCPQHVDIAKENWVFNDAKATVELAAKELFSLNLDCYAFVGYLKHTGWSENRKKEFESFMALHGRRIHMFDPCKCGRCAPGELEERLARWIGGLPRPLGIMAANDQIAGRVANACRLAQLAIPNDVAVIGIDNDEEVCEASETTLSSIDLDFTAVGRLEGEILERLMANPKADPAHTTYPPLRLVRRKSTHRFAKRDVAVERAVERIRREACEGVAAQAILKEFPCSRRMAEIRFRSIVGRSILQEIRRVRLETAQSLLLHTPAFGMDDIAGRCGYDSSSAFSTFFRHETGHAPSAWRERNVKNA